MTKAEKELLEEIEEFLKRTKIPPTRFGVEATGDRHLVSRLRAGRGVLLRTVHRIRQYMGESDSDRRVA